MINVIGVKFKNAGKVYHFDPNDIKVAMGDKVIVETSRGIEFGTAVGDDNICPREIKSPLRRIIRIATEEDKKKYSENDSKKERAMEICQAKIKHHNLAMKLVDVEYTFDNNKIIFFFTSAGRVDFRNLVKDLAGVFKMRIELCQIGVRDEAKLLGGIGNCGRGLCCHKWLSEFHPVSVKMAKSQNLSLNPTKISGICGRLMCCLKYENDVYYQLKKGLPEIGEKVEIDEGSAIVIDTVVLESKVKCRLIIEEGNKEKEIPRKLSTEIYTHDKADVKRLDRRRKEQKKNVKGDKVPKGHIE